ncbi:MAG: hypothetical protein ACLQIB_41155 [Isosphaeraceae bacterium]
MKAHCERRFEVEPLEQRAVPSALLAGHVGLAASHTSPADVRLIKIHATGEGEITSFNQTTGQVTTSGEINNGLLRGTTTFSAQITDAEGDYVGSTTIATKHGNVFLTDTGVLNANGTFTDHATITGGTRRFDRAAGSLVFQGHELSDGVHFVDDSITGTVGLNRSRNR